MKLATFNINGIKARIEALPAWLAAAQPDVVCLQEIKSVDEAFPREVSESMGYQVETHGQKSFNGVAILSKLPLEDITRGLPGDETDEQARWIEATVIAPPPRPGLRPLPAKRQPHAGAEIRLQTRLDGPDGDPRARPPQAGRAHHLLRRLQRDPARQRRCQTRAVANRRPRPAHLPAPPTALACCPSASPTPSAARNPAPGQYTFWDYQAGAWERNNGIRIDHLLLSPLAADLLKDCQIDKQVRAGDKPSDHVPIWIELDA